MIPAMGGLRVTDRVVRHILVLHAAVLGLGFRVQGLGL